MSRSGNNIAQGWRANVRPSDIRFRDDSDELDEAYTIRTFSLRVGLAEAGSRLGLASSASPLSFLVLLTSPSQAIGSGADEKIEGLISPG